VEGRPDGFLDWLSDRHPERADPNAFLPRRLYAAYLQDRLEAVERSRPGLVQRVVGDVISIAGATVRLAGGQVVSADAVVLATGNPAPRIAGPGGHGRLIVDSWSGDALARIGIDDDLVILGSGLTMADAALWLDAHGWRGVATVVSRRGLKPRPHAAGHVAPAPPTPALLAGPLSRRLAELRRISDEAGWQAAMEGLRPVTADLWQAADLTTRARFLRHLRAWWDVHRHRIAPGVSDVLTGMEADGRLRIVAGRIEAVVESAEDVAVSWRPAGGSARVETKAAWAIDCTGPGHAPLSTPLTAGLIDEGRARLDPLGLGLDLDADGRVIGAGGGADPALFVLGPPAYAAFWETTAAPDIRGRIERLTTLLTRQINASR
jgi:uncharacterized NAD(P)/FAD-binding protein YdhS